MNVHKHIPCQVPALCMLSKHPGVSYRFSEYWCHKQQGENWRQCIIHMMEERDGCRGRACSSVCGSCLMAGGGVSYPDADSPSDPRTSITPHSLLHLFVYE